VATFPSLFRAKAVQINQGSVSAFVPHVFGDTVITIRDFLGPQPSAPGMGWVFFQAGNPEFPVWTSGLGSGNGGPGVSDHGALTGLLDDDHPQYLTLERGDETFLTPSEADELFLTPQEGNTAYAGAGHTHPSIPLEWIHCGATDNQALTAAVDTTLQITKSRGSAGMTVVSDEIVVATAGTYHAGMFVTMKPNATAATYLTGTIRHHRGGVLQASAQDSHSGPGGSVYHVVSVAGDFTLAAGDTLQFRINASHARNVHSQNAIFAHLLSGPGQQGIPGVDGAEGPAGPEGPPGQGFDFVGDWEVATTYEELDVVTHEDVTYIATIGNTGVEPTSVPVEVNSATYRIFQDLAELSDQWPSAVNGARAYIINDDAEVVFKGGTWRWWARSVPKTTGNTEWLTWGAGAVTATSASNVTLQGRSLIMTLQPIFTTGATSGNVTTIGTMAAGWRPSTRIDFSANMGHASGAGSGRFIIYDTGGLQALWASGDNPTAASQCYVVAHYILPDLVPVVFS
jgi:hypothetical protein